MFFRKNRFPVKHRVNMQTGPLRAQHSGRTCPACAADEGSSRRRRFFVRAPDVLRPLPAALPAGMTVEASVALPLFIFFMAEILYVFEMIRFQSRLLAALHETGTIMSEYAFYAEYALDDAASVVDSATGTDVVSSLVSDLEELLEEESGLAAYGVSALLSETYVQTSIEEYLGTEWMENSCLYGGADGISWLQSQILVEDGIIDLVADYQVKPFLSIFGIDSFSMQSRYYGHAWTGYDIPSDTSSSSEDGDTDDIIVYITPSGSVYHLTSDCTYLKPSTRTISADLVDSARSSDGSRYYPCEVCNPEKTGTVVITTDGNRYHSSAQCSAISRTVTAVLLSEVEDTMRCCSKCGGE